MIRVDAKMSPIKTCRGGHVLDNNWLTFIFLTVVSNHSVAGGYGNATGSPLQGYVYDPSGQIAPPGAKPRVTATLWEDEGSLCYQVEAKGVCVARREGE